MFLWLEEFDLPNETLIWKPSYIFFTGIQIFLFSTYSPKYDCLQYNHITSSKTTWKLTKQVEYRLPGPKLECLSGFTKMNVKWLSTFCSTRAYVVDHLIYSLAI